jgi:hypothetical protein
VNQFVPLQVQMGSRAGSTHSHRRLSHDTKSNTSTTTSSPSITNNHQVTIISKDSGISSRWYIMIIKIKEGFLRLSITNKTIDWLNIYIFLGIICHHPKLHQSLDSREPMTRTWKAFWGLKCSYPIGHAHSLLIGSQRPHPLSSYRLPEATPTLFL